ncbi:MAG: Npt1/Npt2 family nucleotide transporter [Vicinamibacterales bacterium]
MSAGVARLLGLSKDEWPRAWPLAAYLFLTTAGSVASKATRDALFLDRFRAVDLPYVDIAIAVLVGVAVALYLRAYRWLSVPALQIGSLCLFAASCVGFWWLSGRGGDGRVVFIAIYLWVGVFGALAPMQVWTLANFVLTTREAKRSFGVIGGGGILGWIVGGLATRLSASWLGAASLLLWVGASLLLSTGLVHLVWRRSRAAAAPVDASVSRPGLRESVRQIAGSAYLQSIAAVIGLASIATTVGGWQFKAIAKASIADTNELAAFFGSFNMMAGLASLVLQVVLTGRVLREAGVGVALFIVPIAMASTTGALLVAGTLAAAAALKASDQVLRYSIDKSTVELLYLPLSAADTFRVKAFIDTVVYRFGDGIGGVLVLLGGAWLGLSPVQMGWITLAAVMAWLAAAAVARRQYVVNLQESIRQHRLDSERAHTAMLDRSAADALALKLQGEPDEILYALSFFEMAGNTTLHPSVPELLRHPAPEVRLRALGVVTYVDLPSVLPQVEAMLADPSIEVRTEALLALTRATNVDPLSRIESVGDFEDYSIQASLAAFLARPGPAQHIETAQLILQRMVGEGGPDGVRVRAEAARVIGMSPDLFDRELRRLLEDDAPDVAREAIRAAGRLGKRLLVHRLIDRIAEPLLTDEVVAALAVMGDRIVPPLREYLASREAPAAQRRELPAVLQAIGTPAAQAVLVEHLLDADTTMRLRVVVALNKLVQLHPTRPFDRAIVDGPGRRDHRPLSFLPGAGGALDGAEPVEQAARVAGAGKRAHLPPDEGAVSGPRPAQRVRRRPVGRRDHPRQRARVPRAGAATGDARPGRAALRSRGQHRAACGGGGARGRGIGGLARRGRGSAVALARSVAAVVRGLRHRRTAPRASRASRRRMGDRTGSAAARHGRGRPRQAEGACGGAHRRRGLMAPVPSALT